MLTELQKYYQQQGICAVGFRCPNQGRCKEVLADFVTAREAFVGSEYEKGTLPRILFVSLDAESEKPGRAPALRTLAAMRDWEEGQCDADALNKGRHWYKTHKLAFDILGPIARERVGLSISFRDIHRYFAHTNSAKCKDALAGSGQGPDLVFANCRRFIPGEVQLLLPDVLIGQGVKAREAIGDAFPIARPRVSHPRNDRYFVDVVTIAHRPVLRMCLTHPGGRNAHRAEMAEAYDWYVRTALSFLREQAPEAATAKGPRLVRRPAG